MLLQIVEMFSTVQKYNIASSQEIMWQNKNPHTVNINTELPLK